MVKKKNVETNVVLFWVAIVTVSVLDGFSSVIGVIPILGDLAAALGNSVWEVIQLGLVYGLFRTVSD